MQRDTGRRAISASVLFRRSVPLLVALAVAGCNTVSPTVSTGSPRGATVAFDSIDGPPRDVFDRLVRDLNTEAQSRQLAVLSRQDSAAYRVRGYFGAQSSSRKSAISWVWDVYDHDRQRVLRINGEETIVGKHRDAWHALDDAAVERIARNSMVELSVFLTSSTALPSGPIDTAYAGASTPEAAGIVRIQQVDADPAPTIGRPRPASESAVLADGNDSEAGAVPLPPYRPRSASLATGSLAAAQ
jgi:hypothetical protein